MGGSRGRGDQKRRCEVHGAFGKNVPAARNVFGDTNHTSARVALLCRPLELGWRCRSDATTALLLFWRSDPEYDLQFASRDDVPDYNRDAFDLTQLIQERVSRGGYSPSSLIGFNPRQDVRIGEPVPGRRVIPAQMMQAVLTR